MNILEVPQVLFQEFSKKMGVGEEWEQRAKYTSINNGRFRLKRVAKIFDETERDQRAKGYNHMIAPMIGYRDDSDSEGPYHIFGLWGLVPLVANELSDVEPCFTIISRADSAGVWALGKGRRMKGVCRAEFGFHGISLVSPSLLLIPVILQRAAELAREAEIEIYWEKDLHPGRDFTRS